MNNMAIKKDDTVEITVKTCSGSGSKAIKGRGVVKEIKRKRWYVITKAELLDDFVTTNVKKVNETDSRK